jgi:ABC-type branched-subunit amino acid transport system ATPase component
MDEILKTHALTKIYSKTAAVNKADMTIYKGDIYGFVGANGAGKTTIIRLITGLAYPTSGTYTLFGTESTSSDIVKARRRISAIVEAPAIYTNMTAAENMNEQCRILGIGGDKNIGLLETVGLSSVAGTRRKAGNFSLGMRQRLGIAMSLLGNPEFMILDEPLERVVEAVSVHFLSTAGESDVPGRNSAGCRLHREVLPVYRDSGARASLAGMYRNGDECGIHVLLYIRHQNNGHRRRGRLFQNSNTSYFKACNDCISSVYSCYGPISGTHYKMDHDGRKHVCKVS